MTSTLFTCRCCASSVSGWVDGHVAAHGWHYIDGIDGPNMICPACYDEPDPLEPLRANGYDARIGLPCPVRDASPAVVTIPAAELARLREIERCAKDIPALMESVRRGGAVHDVNRAQFALHRRLRDLCDLAATTPTDPPAAFHGSIPHDTNGDIK